MGRFNAETLEVSLDRGNLSHTEVPVDHTPPWKRASIVFHTDDREIEIPPIRRPLDQAEPYENGIAIDHAKGNQLWTSHYLQTCRLLDGKTVKLSGTFQAHHRAQMHGRSHS